MVDLSAFFFCSVWILDFCFPMDLPAVQLLCLEQGDHPLELQMLDFLHLVCQTHYPDRSLCVFYHASLSKWLKARIPADGLREDYPTFVE